MKKYRLLGLPLLCAATAFAAPTNLCNLAAPKPSDMPKLFGKELDATHQFTLEVTSIQPGPGWNVPLIYVARDAAHKIVSINPTLVTIPGGSLHFALYNCLSAADIAQIRNYNPLDPALPQTTAPGDFNAIPAPEMSPAGYVNFHSHGLHGTPTAGTPSVAAGDEVLATFLSPFGNPSTDPHVSYRQEYRIAIPANQDPGLYWYHPHLHGESQPQVFLGLTGAILVVAKQPHDPTGSASIRAELMAHPDPSSHPSVYIVRDFPVSYFPSSADADRHADSVLPASAASVQRQSRRHREKFLASTAGGRGAEQATTTRRLPQSQPAGDARCALFRAPGSQSPCLPDAVTSDGGDPPSLATLVTVNGRLTETPAGSGPDSLTFQPLTPQTSDSIIRVLNASANTYVKLSLSTAPLAAIQLNESATQTVPTVKLKQLRRDGVPVRQSLRDVDAILLPPGGRAEFTVANPVSAPLSLVSQYFDTGPAGDLVPPRTLVSLGQLQASPATSDLTTDTEVSARFQGAYKAADAHETRRAFAFFEQDRNCAAGQDCGTTFYLMDITASAVGLNGQKVSVSQAAPFVLSMRPDGTPDRDLFDPSGLLKASTPAIQISLHGQQEVDEEWDIYNFTGEAHAFHIHQLGFRVTEACSPRFLAAQSLSPDCLHKTGAQGDENHEVGLVMDVIDLPPGYSQSATGGSPVVYPAKVHLRVPFTADIIGNFVMHCHLLEHEDNGMMMGVQVWKNAAPAAPANPPQTMSMP